MFKTQAVVPQTRLVHVNVAVQETPDGLWRLTCEDRDGVRITLHRGSLQGLILALRDYGYDASALEKQLAEYGLDPISPY